MTDLKNKVAIITGANSGLGYETALNFAGLSAKTILACRDVQKGTAARDQILERYPDAKIDVIQLDLSSQKLVKEFVRTFASKYDQLDLLVNNAGIMMTPHELTEDGFENQFATNYLGHFALTSLLMPFMLASPGARIISLSSLAHKWSDKPYDDLDFLKRYKPSKAYGQSKLACLIFAMELNRRIAKHKCDVKSVAAHPGLSNTNLFRALPTLLKWLSPLVSQSARYGAKTILHAALNSKINGGEYIGPGGFKEWWGVPVEVESSKAAQNLKIADDLWRLSSKLTGLDFNFQSVNSNSTVGYS